MRFFGSIARVVMTTSLLASLSCQSSTRSAAVSPGPQPPSVLVRRSTITPDPPAAKPVEVLSPASATAASGPPPPPAKPWWEIPYPTRFDAAQLNQALPRVSVVKNRFVNEKGATVTFRGVSIADPDKLVQEGQWRAELFQAIQAWGANVVRIPVHPAAFRGLGRDAYFKLLDQGITWANSAELYVIIDWHSIGNLAKGLFQHPMYETTKAETYEFWRSIAFRYQPIPTVAMLELFNEPTTFRGNLGVVSWAEWKNINEEIIDIVRSHGNTAIPLVAGFDWAYELMDVAKAPIDRPAIAYVSHPYPQKTTPPFEPKWNRAFGFVAAKYPLIATEIGYMPPDAPGAHVPVKDDGSYGKLITDYLANQGASWVAWCFHPHWAPPLISDWAYTPTASGEHFRKVMLGQASGPT